MFSRRKPFAFFLANVLTIQTALSSPTEEFNTTSRNLYVHETKDIETNSSFQSEHGITGSTWRSFLKHVIISRLDSKNQLRLSRGLQFDVAFSAVHEAYLLDLVIGALESSASQEQLKEALSLAFKNRNVSRIIVQNLGRFDFFWHNSTRVAWNRIMDAVLDDFPGTENATPSSDNASNSLFHKLLGKSNWFSRFITNREELITDNPNAPAQNLAAESNGLEFSARAQNGTNLGRETINAYRFDHRLPVDESAVRTFTVAPSSTLANNGFEHVMRAVAKHWNNMLSLPSGNFAHQKMEQLDPFETLRFIMPEVLTELVALRGINHWDQTHLAPFMRKLEDISPEQNIEDIKKIAEELEDHILPNVCGHVHTRYEPFKSWIQAIRRSLDVIAQEAIDVKSLVESVREGLDLGQEALAQIDWSLPSDKKVLKDLKYYLKNHNKKIFDKSALSIDPQIFSRALSKLASKDKATLDSLFESRNHKRSITKFLMSRVNLLVKREIHRANIDECFQKISLGSETSTFEEDAKYWIEAHGSLQLYVIHHIRHGFVDCESVDGAKQLTFSTLNPPKSYTYRPVAESIVKAQAAWMNFELDFQKKFSTNAFMEFKDLRKDLRTLQILGQLQSKDLDTTKLDLLEKTKSDSQNPQSVMIIGGGPTGLLSAMHSLDASLPTGGQVSLHEKRDAFKKGGSAFERSQVVRLDPRWIAMLRYHLGTSFEDMFIRLMGETQPHRSNSFPALGFIELTIKDLEDLMQVRISEMRSRGLIDYYTQSSVEYDVDQNIATKKGRDLKLNDQVIYNETPWVVSSMTNSQKPGQVFERIRLTSAYEVKTLNFEDIANQDFVLDTKKTHIITAIGKPKDSPHHFKMTPSEPYGVCCLTGAKISLGMHEMGNKRWGNGLVDDFRSASDDNTRLIGDFTKKILTVGIIDEMLSIAKTNEWKLHIHGLLDSAQLILNKDAFVDAFYEHLENLRDEAPNFTRKSLQSRNFETGDNSYLGMEFPREFEMWRENTLQDLTLDKKFQFTLSQCLDRLFFQGALNIIHDGDVFNPGAKGKIPFFYLIDSKEEILLSSLPKGAAFVLDGKRYEVLAQSHMNLRRILVRDMQGQVLKLYGKTKVFRAGDLSRGPDGDAESKVSIATFDVAHYVNHRTIRVKDKAHGSVYAPMGDEQSSPHFMRYSGLTGAAINAMEFKKFIARSETQSLAERVHAYSHEIDWSNSEVVTRGIGAGFGEDGFLRPGFRYTELLDFLHSKIIERMEGSHDHNDIVIGDILPSEWQDKIIAGLVPRQLEHSQDFLAALLKSFDHDFHQHMIKSFTKVFDDQEKVSHFLHMKIKALSTQDFPSFDYWERVAADLHTGDKATDESLEKLSFVGASLEMFIKEMLDHAQFRAVQGHRISSEISNQPKPVDSITDDFAVEAQGFADGLSAAAAFQATALSLNTAWLRPTNATLDAGAILGTISPIIAFGTVTNASRYKRRNEDAQTMYANKLLPELKKSIFKELHPADQKSMAAEVNPMISDLQQSAQELSNNIEYYGYQKPENFDALIENIVQNPDQLGAYHNATQSIITEMIPVTYQDQPYLKDMLLALAHKLIKTQENIALGDAASETNDIQIAAKNLLEKIQAWEVDVHNRLEDGDVTYGWHRDRQFKNKHVVASGNYLLGGLREKLGGSKLKTFIMRTSEVLNDIQALSAMLEANQRQALQREIHNLEHFILATKEVTKTSMIVTNGWISMVAGISLTLGRILPVTETLKIASIGAHVGGILGPIPAVLSIHLFTKKQKILNHLAGSLKVKMSEDVEMSAEQRENLERIQKILSNVSSINKVRMAASGLAGVALPFNLVAGPLAPAVLPMAATAVGLTVGSSISMLAIEYKQRHYLNEAMPQLLCEAFREEIEEIYQSFKQASSRSDERTTWEYTAREFLHLYRFDGVFAADRFGSILQYIQGGMKPTPMMIENDDIRTPEAS